MVGATRDATPVTRSVDVGTTSAVVTSAASPAPLRADGPGRSMRETTAAPGSATEPDPRTLLLRRNGIVVDYDAKFSHHTSGIVHFSKTGASDVLPERRSFPLTGPIGRLFWFYAFSLDGFAKHRRADRRNEIGLAFPVAAHPTSVHVTAEWLRKKDIAANTASGEGIVGPSLKVEHRSSGHVRQCIVIGQPQGYPLQDHVVMLSASEVPLPSGANSSTSVFCGGWDEHEGRAPDTARMLVFMYPIGEEAGVR